MNKKAFTLAEILIALTIIGIISTLLLKNLVNKIYDRVQITAVKKTWAMLDNALQEMYIIEGIPSTWNWTPYKTKGDQANFFAQRFINYVNVEKYCGSNAGCFPSKNDSKCSAAGYGIYCNLHNRSKSSYIDNTHHGKFKLKNGMSISTAITPWLFSTDVVTDNTNKFRVDINGNKGPNRLGYDVFFFEFNDKGLLLANADYWSYKYCNNATNLKTESSVYPHIDGVTCSTWIIKHNNMDYKYRNIKSEW